MATIGEMINGKANNMGDLFSKLGKAVPARAAVVTEPARAKECDPPLPTDLPVVGWEWITPERAAALLKTSEGNRAEKDGQIGKLARILSGGGTWWPGAALMHVDSSGHLINGHHRCKAIVKSDVGAWVLVARNCSRAMIAALDDGAMRTIADKLRLLYKVHVSNTMIGAVRTLIQLNRDVEMTSVIGFDDFAAGLEDAPLAAEWMTATVDQKFNAPVWGALGYAYQAFPEQIDTFTRQIKTRANLPENSPALALLNFTDRHASKTGARDKQMTVWKTLSCAAAHCRGETRTHTKDTDVGLRWFKARVDAARRREMGT